MTHTPPQEPAFQLASMTPPKRRTGLIATLATGGVLVVAAAAGGIGYALAGSGSPAPGAPPSAASTTASESATHPAATARTARDACLRLASVSSGIPDDAFTAADLTALQDVGEQAGASDSQSIATEGLLLTDTVKDAAAANGQGSLMAEVKQRVRDLRKACAVAGYPV